MLLHMFYDEFLSNSSLFQHIESESDWEIGRNNSLSNDCCVEGSVVFREVT